MKLPFTPLSNAVLVYNIDRTHCRDSYVSVLIFHPFYLSPDCLTISLRSEHFLVAKTGIGLCILDHAKCIWTTWFTLLVRYHITFYQYHQSLIGLSGAESIWLDIGLGPGT